MKGKVLILPVLLLLLIAPAFQVMADGEEDTESWERGWGMMGPGAAGGFGGMMGPGMMGGFGGGMMGPGLMGGFGGGMMGGFAHLEALQQALDLDDQQISRLRTLWLQYIRGAAPIEADLQVARAELQIQLHNLLGPGTFNQTQVEQAVRRIEELQGNLRVAQLRALGQGVGVLNDEQVQQLRFLFRSGRRGFFGGDYRSDDGRPRLRQQQNPGGMMGPGPGR